MKSNSNISNIPIDETVDFVAKILRRGLSFISSYVSLVGNVDLTAKARRFGGEERSSLGAISCGGGGGGGGAAAAIVGSVVVCRMNCC